MEPETSIHRARYICNIYDQLVTRFLFSLMEQIPLCIELNRGRKKNAMFSVRHNIYYQPVAQFFVINYCSDMFRSHRSSFVREMTSLYTCAAYISTYVVVTLHISVQI